MGQANAYFRRLRGGFTHWCDGCDMLHKVMTNSPTGPNWQFNGDLDKATFTPSVKVDGVLPLTELEQQKIMAGKQVEPRPFVCHYFITDGNISYCPDSTHHLSGKTVKLPELPDYLRDD